GSSSSLMKNWIIAGIVSLIVYLLIKPLLICPAAYLNPWQYFASCSLFNLAIFLLVFALIYASRYVFRR
ncbi:MAG TPA: hypothetical protein VFF28_06300, partial [Candidatus Nanoarchaeia archaeon]|nr:hypothetical protein [Candidatus Nanoarchaeia archaeon]